MPWTQGELLTGCLKGQVFVNRARGGLPYVQGADDLACSKTLEFKIGAITSLQLTHPSTHTPACYRDDDGWGPLAMACMHGNAECARMLLKAGANVNAVTCYGSTPIIFAGGLLSWSW